ncbi:MAG TPA: DUF4286 family protein [Paludibacteraceae bacterium]|nr:DUF4286 family protein [Paludibacteraceae bacterium]HQB68898.1 DUF4286 family protein [Paludibacteraceae bacterium]
MILYNTTFGVENSAIADWLAFMKMEFMPTMAKELHHVKLCKIMIEHPEGLTSFALHGSSDSHEQLKAWQTTEQLFLRQLRTQFGERVLWFSTLMEEV